MMVECDKVLSKILLSVVLTEGQGGQGHNDLEKRSKIGMIVTESLCDRMSVIVTKGHSDINQRSLLP